MTLQRMMIKLNKFKVIKPNGCWEISLTTKDRRGHSTIRVGPIKMYVHRISAAYYLGLDLNDRKLQALHKNECGNPGCWNPDHLHVGTYKDNLFDRYELKGSPLKGRKKGT